MVGMSVGLEQPLHFEAFRFDVIDQLLCGGVRGAAGCCIIVQYAVDDGTGIRLRIAHHMADREGLIIEERCDDGASRGVGEGVLDERSGKI
ncbi:hypothetical protein D3C72_2339610 [compost metagenome]